MNLNVTDGDVRDDLLNEAVQSAAAGSAAHARQLLMAAGLFAMAQQIGRIADVLEKIEPLIDIGVAEARKETGR